MNYYTQKLPIELAKKLREAGMKMGLYHDIFADNTGTTTTFAEVLDWLMSEKSYLIIILRSEGRWCYWVGLTTDYDSYDDTYEIEGEDFDTWHEAATKAIEKALEIISKTI